MSECKTLQCHLARLKTKIKKNNEAFSALSPEEKRVFIAWDVIGQVEAKKLIPTSGSFVTTSSYVEFDEDDKKSKEMSFTDLIKKNKTSCDVCALGAMFMSSLKGKDLTCGEIKEKEGDINYLHEHTMLDRLGEFFDVKQLKAIEVCFEENDGAFSSTSEKTINKWLNHIKNLLDVDLDDRLDADLKMRLIMEHLVVNNGTFSPSKQELMPYLDSKDTEIKTPGFPYPKKVAKTAKK